MKKPTPDQFGLTQSQAEFWKQNYDGSHVGGRLLLIVMTLGAIIGAVYFIPQSMGTKLEFGVALVLGPIIGFGVAWLPAIPVSLLGGWISTKLPSQHKSARYQAAIQDYELWVNETVTWYSDLVGKSDDRNFHYERELKCSVEELAEALKHDALQNKNDRQYVKLVGVVYSALSQFLPNNMVTQSEESNSSALIYIAERGVALDNEWKEFLVSNGIKMEELPNQAMQLTGKAGS